MLLLSQLYNFMQKVLFIVLTTVIVGILIQMIYKASLIAQLVKNLPAMWEVWVQSLGWEDPLEKGRATPPVFWPGEFHRLSMGAQKVGHD